MTKSENHVTFVTVTNVTKITLSLNYEQINNNKYNCYKKGRFVMERKESNKLTRDCITTALLILLMEKPYEEITITDITEKAGVSRMAYYRNYKTKDDILIDKAEEEIGKFFVSIKEKDMTIYGLIVKAGNYFRENIDFIIALGRADLMNTFLERIRQKIYESFPSIEENTDDEYITHFYIGAIVAVLRCWIEKGMTESIDEISDIICRNIRDDIMQRFEETKQE